MSTIEQATKELHKAFNMLNKEFFGGSLPMVALTIQTKGKRLALGWFSVEKIWTGEGIEMHELNISAETLNRPYEEIMRTLLHEMVHLYCAVQERPIKDTSRGGTFHNKNFKEAAEKHGFFYDEPADARYGWAFPKLTPETIKLINNGFKFQINKAAFKIARLEPDSSSKKTNSFKWVCPNCEAKVRSTKEEVKLVCGDCSDFEDGLIVNFELEG
jgi:hypothetical protein